MPNQNIKLVVGPLLGVESEELYTVCFFTGKDVGAAEVRIDDKTVAATAILDTPNGRFWRAAHAIEVPVDSRTVAYSISCDGTPSVDQFRRDQWSFYVPGKDEHIRIAYASCNGFSSRPAGDHQYVLWSKLRDQHQEKPFSLLVMGGDQLYADEIWQTDRAKFVRNWADRPLKDRIKATASASMHKELDSFYESLYARHWKKEDMALMMASVPSLMMWDDHDIFDGWGSYPDNLQGCAVYQAIYAAACKYFKLFQLRSDQNRCLLNPGANHYSYALGFRGYRLLAMDNRSERSKTQVMSPQNWSDVKAWLDGQASSPSKETLLVLSAVPVVYRSFARAGAIIKATPWHEELEDDIYDHWSAEAHEGERMRLVMNLLNYKDKAQREGGRLLILSGDVHVGSLGVIRDLRKQPRTSEIVQIVSSGIVHPAPSPIQWAGFSVSSTDTEESLYGGRISTENIKPFGSDKFIRSRNYATLEEGNDEKLWINWVCEDGVQPEYPVSLS